MQTGRSGAAGEILEFGGDIFDRPADRYGGDGQEEGGHVTSSLDMGCYGFRSILRIT